MENHFENNSFENKSDVLIDTSKDKTLVSDENTKDEDKKVIGTTDSTVIYQKTNQQGQELPVTVVCMNHADVGIDEFVNELEQPPDLYQLESVSYSAWQPPSTCKFCNEKPVLLIV